MFHLLTNAEVFAPAPLGRVHLLVAAGKIVWMGTEAIELPKSLNVEAHDLDGLRVIPGLIDGHAHVTGGGGESGYASAVPPVGLSEFTSAGVTTVVGVLGTDDLTRSTSSLLARVLGLAEEGLNAFCYTGGYHLPPRTLTGSLRSDIVYLERVLGAGEIAISDHRSSQPTRDQILWLASEVHVAGLMTGKAGILHLHVGDGERGLSLIEEALDCAEIPARVYHPTHVNRRCALFGEALRLAERGCTIDITAFPVGPEEEGLSAAAALGQYLDSGLPANRVTVSSDGGGCLPVFDREGRVTGTDVGRSAALLETIGELLEADRVLEDILPAFTSNVAELLRLPGKGQLAAGADADLVVLDSHHRVHSVMARGVWHIRAGEVLRRGQFETSV